MRLAIKKYVATMRKNVSIYAGFGEIPSYHDTVRSTYDVTKSPRLSSFIIIRQIYDVQPQIHLKGIRESDTLLIWPLSIYFFAWPAQPALPQIPMSLYIDNAVVTLSPDLKIYKQSYGCPYNHV